MSEEEMSNTDSEWNAELEAALAQECDFGSLRNICKGRPVPEKVRPEVWQICLQVQGKGDSLSSFDGFFDLPEQTKIREDCKLLVDKLGNEEDEKVSVVGDIESMVTFFCKSRQEPYTSDNGWLDILQPLLALKLSKSEVYNCFYSLINKYITRDCMRNGKPFHLFRLLLQYHDPELCSFLDTKRITPDMYAQTWFRSLFASVCDLKVILNMWDVYLQTSDPFLCFFMDITENVEFRSLFASVCDLKVILNMWDVYLQTSDPFLCFFMALVILVNARDQILEKEDQNKQQIMDLISSFPSALEAEDIEDFCSLAQYYASKTPQSFRRDYEKPLFGTSLAKLRNNDDLDISQLLCLPVSVGELVQSVSLAGGDGVKYFVVDCRPAEQYNKGHLPTAMHLDANLMLQNPEEFNTAVQGLFSAQSQAILAGSAAGGEHLCFVGSGREEEDQYVNMVIANFLQKHHQYISVAKGGYLALRKFLQERGNEDLAKACMIPGLDNFSDTESGDDLKNDEKDEMNDSIFSRLSSVVKSKSTEMKEKLTNYIKNEQLAEERHDEMNDSIFSRLSSVVKSKSTEMKEKLTNYIKNEQLMEERHVSNTDRVGKRYRNMASVFTIGDEEEEKEAEEQEVVSLETWLKKPDVVYSCPCREVDNNGYLHPSHLLVTDSHLYILREIPKKKGMAYIQGRRALGTIVKITSKKRHPDLITFSYGSNEETGIRVTNKDRCVIPSAGEATKRVKQQIMKVLDALES